MRGLNRANERYFDVWHIQESNRITAEKLRGQDKYTNFYAHFLTYWYIIIISSYRKENFYELEDVLYADCEVLGGEVWSTVRNTDAVILPYP